MDAKKDQKTHTIKEKLSEWLLKKSVALQVKWGPVCQEERLEKEIQTTTTTKSSSFCRSKRTQAETVKLKRIQKELQALDDMVSADIGILRNRIDQASLDYSYAR